MGIYYIERMVYHGQSISFGEDSIMAEKLLRSRINRIVRSDEMAWDLIELNKSAIRHGDKVREFYRILDRNAVAFEPLGVGTNRVGVKIDGFCLKYSLNTEGLFDTRREMYLSKSLGRDTVMVHEITADGTLGTYEYVRTISSKSELMQYYEKIDQMLQRITAKFFVGDMGITEKNMRNIGVRADGSVCSIDFAYIKNVKSTDLICPYCHSMYQFEKGYTSVHWNCRSNIKFEELRRFFSDDSKDLERIPQQSYRFDGELEKTVELDPSKSIIIVTRDDEADIIRKKRLERREEERYKAEEMLLQNRFVMPKKGE